MVLGFSSLLRDYRRQLFELSRRMLRCAPVAFLLAIPTVAVNQVSFILSMMLPLKVIILIGSEGIPRFLRFLVTDQTKDQWIIYFLGLAIGFFLLYLLTNRALVALSDFGGSQIRKQSDKVTLFHAEAEFSSQVFSRLAESWGTFVIVFGGVGLGLLLEWRMVVVVIIAMLIQTLALGWYWNRHQAPEHDQKRQQFVEQRMQIVNNLAHINTFIAFGALVALFLTDPKMNFLIGLVMFILTRQVLARVVKSIADGYFLIQQRERIDALVVPERHVREKRKPSEVSFESLLMPTNRHKIFDSLAQFDLRLETSDRQWQWCDYGPRGQALYVSHATQAHQPELRLKVLRSAKDAGLAREAMFYESESCARLSLSPTMLATGSVYGRGFILLSSSVLTPCSGQQFPQLLKQVRYALWQHVVDDSLRERLARSYAALDQRLDAERYGRIRLGCNTSQDQEVLDQFLHSLGTIQAWVATLPKVLVNKNLTAANMMVTEAGEPMVMNWDAISYDVMGSGLSVHDISTDYTPKTVLAHLADHGHAVDDIDPRALSLVAHISLLDVLISREAYGAALMALGPILELLHEAKSNLRGSSPEVAMMSKGHVA